MTSQAPQSPTATCCTQEPCLTCKQLTPNLCLNKWLRGQFSRIHLSLPCQDTATLVTCLLSMHTVPTVSPWQAQRLVQAALCRRARLSQPGSWGSAHHTALQLPFCQLGGARVGQGLTSGQHPSLLQPRPC